MRNIIEILSPFLLSWFKLSLAHNANRLKTLKGCFEAQDLGAPSLVTRLSGEWMQAGNIPGHDLDSPGIFYFVPRLGKMFSLDLDSSLKLFLGSLILLSMVIGAWAFSRMFQNWTARIVAWFLLFTTVQEIAIVGDVYSLQGFSVLLSIPVLVSYQKLPFKNPWILKVVMFFLGCFLAYANLIRDQAGSGAFLFILLWMIFLDGKSWSRRFILLVFLLSGFFLANLHFMVLERNRDAFIKTNNPTFACMPVRHPHWHSMYIALGFAPNQYVPVWDDSVGFAAARKIDPNVTFCSDEYENIMRRLTLELIFQHPYFFVKQCAKKFIQMMEGLWVGHLWVGVLIAFWIRLPWRQWVPFVVCGALYCSTGVIVAPIAWYVIGLYMTGAVFNIWMVGLAIDRLFEIRHRQRLAMAFRVK